MIDASSLLPNLILWLSAAAIAVTVQRQFVGPGNSLVAIYLVNSWLIYWPGALIYTLPWYLGVNRDIVPPGFQQSLYGIAAFSIAVIVTSTLLRARAGPRQAAAATSIPGNSAWTYLLAGLLSYGVLFPISGIIPSLTAILSMSNLLTIAGLFLLCLEGWQQGNWRQFLGSLAFGLALPLFTVLSWGFLGFGAIALSYLLLLVASIIPFRIRFIPIGLLLLYVSLSVYVTYIRDRIAIRASVWANAAYGERTDIFWQSIDTFELFDMYNSDHLRRIDDRINQNILIGQAIEYIDIGYIDFAQGSSLVDALLSMVPRVIWPDKPIVAGGNQFVSDYTGVVYSRSTSVGAGQVFEFYINFGTPGVIVGFAVLGIVVAGFDWAAAAALQRGNVRGFTFWLLGGLGLMQVNGALSDMTASLLGGLAAAYLINQLVTLIQERRRRPLAQSTPTAAKL